MKKAIYSVIAISFGFINQAFAQIPNPGFEQWDSSLVIDGTKIINPQNWFSSNEVFVGIGMEQSCNLTDDAHSGNFALQLTSKSDDSDEQGTFITNGNNIGEGPSDPSAAKFKLEGRVNGFEGYYKYAPVGVDSFRVFLALYRDGQYIGQSFIYISEATATYKKFFWPVNYPATVTPPDSAKFIIEPSVINGSEGSVLTIDDLGITYGFSSGINDEDVAVSFELYPNPTTKSLNIKLNETLSELTFKIFDAKGTLVLADIYNGYGIDVANLPQGLYKIVVQTATGKTSNKTWIKN
jgi:hypothetical protein